MTALPKITSPINKYEGMRQMGISGWKLMQKKSIFA